MTAYMDHKNLANEVIDDARAREITDGVHRVLDRIAAAEEQAGREAGSVRLLAATKTRDIGEIMVAIDAGVRMIGENRPQEVTAKAKGLARRCAERGFSLGVAGVAPDAAAEHIPFHLIGQLQSNKIGKVLPVVDTIESVDSIDLAEKISRRAVARGITVGVLLEVNESGEESKSGCDCDCSCDCACSFDGRCDSPSSIRHCASSLSVADCPATSCPAMSATSDPTAFSASDCCVDSGWLAADSAATLPPSVTVSSANAVAPAPVVPASIAIVTSNAVNFPIRAPHRLMKPASGSFIHFMTCPSLMALRRIAYAPPCLEPYG